MPIRIEKIQNIAILSEHKKILNLQFIKIKERHRITKKKAINDFIFHTKRDLKWKKERKMKSIIYYYIR